MNGHRQKRLGLSMALAVIGYFALWPVPIQPLAWDAPKAPAVAANERLRGVEVIGADVAHGPEASAIDDAGRVFTGTRDGLILRLDPGSRSFQRVAATGGRPLGFAFDRRTGGLYVCDADKGLLWLSPSGELKTLATQNAGLPFRFTDDVDVAPDGNVYFTDASSKFGVAQMRQDFLEHGGHGRLLVYHPDAGTTEELMAHLQFANGVAVAEDGSYVVVNETGAYRTLRYWLKGPKVGTAEPLVENLPGLPDNVTWSPARKAFWIALYSPRVPALDNLAPYPFLRKVVDRVPELLQPQPKHHAWALAVDEQGRSVEDLQDASPSAYAPVTSVRERDGALWIGSLAHDGLGRIAAPPIR